MPNNKSILLYFLSFIADPFTTGYLYLKRTHDKLRKVNVGGVYGLR